MIRKWMAGLMALVVCCTAASCAQVGDPATEDLPVFVPAAPKEKTEDLFPVPSAENTLLSDRTPTEMEGASLLAVREQDGRQLLWCEEAFDFDFQVTDEKANDADAGDCLTDLIISEPGDYIAVVGTFAPEHGISHTRYAPSPSALQPDWNCNFGGTIRGTTYRFQAEKYVRGDGDKELPVYIRNIGIMQAADGHYYNNNYIDFTVKNAAERQYVLLLAPEAAGNYGYTVRQMYCLDKAPQNGAERWLRQMA